MPTTPLYCNNLFENVIGSGDRQIIITNESINLNNLHLSGLILCNADDSNIINVTINGSQTYKNNGLFTYFLDNSDFTDITSNNNRYGLHIASKSATYTSNNNKFNTITANENQNYGIYTSSVYYNNFTNLNLMNNTKSGAYIYSSAYNNFNDLSILNNVQNGLHLYYANNNNIQDVYSAGRSTSFGLYCQASSNNVINNLTTSNFQSGLRIETNSHNTTLHDIDASHNSQYGAYFYNSNNNNISSVVTSFNSLYGIRIQNSQNNIIRNITVSYNTRDGFSMYNSGHSIINDIIANNNNWNGFSLENGNYYHNITNITSNNNKYYGINIEWNSDYNDITESHFINNTQGGIRLEKYSTAYHPEFNFIYNNYFKNDINYNIDADIINMNYWNTSSHAGTNIAGGSTIGGNFWAAPDKTGFADNCSDGNGDDICDSQHNLTNNSLQIDYLPLIRPPVQPNASDFTPSSDTTDFSTVPNIRNVQNMSLQTNGKGKIQFPTDHGIYADSEDYNANVKIGYGVIYANTSALHSTFNHSAVLTFNEINCSMAVVYYSETASTREAILAENNQCVPPRCQDIICSNGVLTVNVSGFSGYAMNGTANLTIDADDPKMTGELVTFTAEYRNTTGLITGAICNISFSDGSYIMNERPDRIYNYSRDFMSSGTINYNVTCSKTGEPTLTAHDTAEITGEAIIPEFSTITLGLGLIAIRRKR